MTKKLLIILYVLTILGCKKETKDSNQITATFEVNDKLLNHTYSNTPLKFEVKTPYNLKEVDSTISALMSQNFNFIKSLNSKFLKGYLNEEDKSSMFIFDVSKNSDSIFSSLNEHYETILNPDSLWNNVQFKKFNHNCFDVDQYVMQNKDNVCFLLHCKSNYDNSIDKTIQLVYVIGRTNFVKNIKPIESSIGSLKCIY